MTLDGTIEFQGVPIKLEDLRIVAASVLHGHGDLVDDAVQAGLVRLYDGRVSSDLRSPAAYAKTVIRNTARNLRSSEDRRQQKHKNIDDDSIQMIPDPDPEPIEEQIDVDALLSSLAGRLTPREQVILGLALDGWKPQAICDRLGISRSTYYNDIGKIKEAILALNHHPDDDFPPDDDGGGGGGAAVRLPPVRGDPQIYPRLRLYLGNQQPIKENRDERHFEFRHPQDGDSQMETARRRRPQPRLYGRHATIRADQLEDFKGLLLQLPAFREDDHVEDNGSEPRNLEEILHALHTK